MKRFFGEPATRWASLRNRLHVYVLPNSELRSALSARQAVLEGVEYCSVQPEPYLHATVQQFATSAEEVSREEVEAFTERLALLAEETEPFSIELGAPVVDDFALGVRGALSPAWTSLVDGVREAAAATINQGRAMPPGPFGPHVTLGYGLADGSGEQLQRESDLLATEPLPALKVASLHFLAVHQDAEAGTFTWDATVPFELGTSRNGAAL
ncbi:2'-5' RNA ligase family protein [Sinomonas albida]|uniref:2'-5' RNA ligase family protein n=1 Tax=Sinomonas albida TaxID=369942 RepID=UPI003016B383